MSLTEPDKKMSKSLGNKSLIALDDEPEVIKEKISKAVTGTGQEKELPQGGKNLIMLLEQFGTQDEVDYFQKQAKNNDVKYGELKNAVANAISQYFAEYRATKKELMKNPKIAEEILKQGSLQADKIAKKSMQEVKDMVFGK